METQKVLVLHGFNPEEAVVIMRAVRAALPSASDTAFAMSTPTSLGWKLQDLVEHVGEEHAQFKAMQAAQASQDKK